MCFVQRDSLMQNLSVDDISDTLRNCKKRSTGIVSITGGEPTLNQDLFRILRNLRQFSPDTEIALLTNGRMFAYKTYSGEFINLGLNNIKVIIPVHGHNDKLHDSITQVKGSFEQTIQGIRNLLDRDVCVELRIIINRLNYRYLKGLSNYIFNEFGNITYLVFIAMEIGKNAIVNKSAVTYTELVPYLEEAIEQTNNGKDKIKLYHIPLCIIDSRYRRLIYKSIEDYKLTFSFRCNVCLYKKECMGILKTYKLYFGDKEFKPISEII